MIREYQNTGYDTEAERRVLCYMLIDSDCIDRFADTLSAEKFYFEFHQELFRALVRSVDEEPVDRVDFVVRRLSKRYSDTVQQIGRLINNYRIGVSCRGHWEYYEAIVHRAFIARGVNKMGAAFHNVDPDRALEIYQREITEFEDKVRLHNGEIPRADEAITKYFERLKSPEESRVQTTGNHWWDEARCIERGGCAILAATPGTGKSAFALQTVNQAIHRGLSVIYFGFEMHSDAIVERLLINRFQISKEELPDEGMSRRVGAYMSELAARATIYGIDHTSGLTVRKIANVIRQVKKQRGVDLVFVDLLKQVIPDNTRSSTLEQYEQKLGDLRRLSGEMDFALVVLHHLKKRDQKDKSNREPGLGDLQYVGHQEATSVTFLHSPNEDLEEITVKIAKNRDGTTGKTEGNTFDKHHQTFRPKDEQLF